MKRKFTKLGLFLAATLAFAGTVNAQECSVLEGMTTATNAFGGGANWWDNHYPEGITFTEDAGVYTFTVNNDLTAGAGYILFGNYALSLTNGTEYTLSFDMTSTADISAEILMENDNGGDNNKVVVPGTEKETAWELTAETEKPFEYIFTPTVDQAATAIVIAFPNPGGPAQGTIFTVSNLKLTYEGECIVVTPPVTPPVAIEEAAANAISIYPNPVQDVLFIDGIESANVQIVNTAGAVVINQVSNGEVNVSGLTQGIYTVLVNGQAFKLIK